MAWNDGRVSSVLGKIDLYYPWKQTVARNSLAWNQAEYTQLSLRWCGFGNISGHAKPFKSSFSFELNSWMCLLCHICVYPYLLLHNILLSGYNNGCWKQDFSVIPKLKVPCSPSLSTYPFWTVRKRENKKHSKAWVWIMIKQNCSQLLHKTGMFRYCWWKYNSVYSF